MIKAETTRDGAGVTAALELAAQGLAPNSTAALLVWEDSWATELADAVRNAQGRVVAYERIPHQVVETALEAEHQISAQH